MPTISPSHRDLLESGHTVTLATVGADGQPQVTAIWAMLDGDHVRTSLHPGRQKYRNLVARPQATLFVIDPGNPYRTLEVRGTVEITEDTDLAFLRRLLAVYGSDLEHFPAPVDGRVVVTLRPTRIVELG
ncbi:PPOX class probable F420-dependent enzyme [Parafrankia irregularis]|uniref:PPOX class probable F420-dependent enzyme n=1 Tax=Parafrankia irregularis TaxID=795642 RepID=A0A0S4QPT8_9ACTN|nr:MULTISPECIES: PPOX class F420-dependent oxidoreductase [Parafrankia]MBE3206152.1 PPOX class F420-dependent oxidoreductase [Parafrankia sp. CH37]CUU57633.1 PPOX class probable F420-dependent enzyme [Parafrankia irregularis]